ncbi:unnamed protein product [Rotaria sordida]|uniref:MATH domain-containing protein n=1 Tax=Rotaria sordida TaxID=392033 RepID=A0A814CYR8_9BILA|nr:unnamed protein product [Rotaria sordida]
MAHHRINDINSTNVLQCPLHDYGCTDSFPRNQLSQHYLSEVHLKSIIKFICAKQINYESALIDLTINPKEIDGLLSSRHNQINNYSQFIERLNTVVIETLQSSNTTDIVSNTLPNINQISRSISSPTRDLIIDMDRSLNCTFDLRSHQQLNQINDMQMNQILSQIDSSSNINEINHHTEQNEQHQDSSLINENNNIQFYMDLNNILQIQLENTPVSTDGILIWRVDEIFKKIDDAICKKQLFINSHLFQTSRNGHRLWARIYLNGKMNPNFISFHVHLNFPVCNTFTGYVKFILVDQSTNNPLQHIIKCCSAKMNNVNDCIGFDDFIDKNLLYKESNPYIYNDSLYFIVYVEQTNQEKFNHLSSNVKDALFQSCSAH